VICTLDLEPDTQGLEQCGSCNRCIESCPTGALRDAGVLDSTLCISYLTIEHRGPIPIEHREAIGTHVYGCDICQEVCPYNLPPSHTDAAPWQPRAALDLPGLVELWRRPDAELRKDTKGSAMTRAKLTGLRRNLAVAIGNSGDATALAALDEPHDGARSSADEPFVREQVEWAKRRRAGRF
jgi:epoxyqueuosine reductase